MKADPCSDRGEGQEGDFRGYGNRIDGLKALMDSRGATHFYVSSTDPYLNEYVPPSWCRRYDFTGFSGSTGQMLFTPSLRVKLFVDGRYHEQADQ